MSDYRRTDWLILLTDGHTDGRTYRLTGLYTEWATDLPTDGWEKKHT